MGRTLITILLGLMLAASPAVAADVTTSTQAVAATVGTAVAMSIVCWAVDLAGRDEDPREGFDRPGWQLGVNFGYGKPNSSLFTKEESESLAPPLVPFDISVEGSDGTFAVNGRAGYRCGRWIRCV